jgi:thiamine-monophosphate kinase
VTQARNIPLGYGGEFDVISAALRRCGPLATGVGDDCAELDVPTGERLLLSVDTAMEGVHFRRQWLSPEEIGYRATTAALSDLAGMAAQPLGVAVAITLPDAWRGDFLRICDGIGDAVRIAGTQIIGGDLSRGDALALAVTVLGHAVRPLARRGARAGDALWVTGQLGGPLVALRMWERGGMPSPECRARFARPVARVPEAQWLASQGATAGIDLSDGLVSDATHLAAASGVRIVIDLDRLPVLAPASIEEAARSGEEYELVVTAPSTIDAAAFEARFGIPLTSVGAVEPSVPGAAPVEARRHGVRVELPRGHDHFPPAS